MRITAIGLPSFVGPALVALDPTDLGLLNRRMDAALRGHPCVEPPIEARPAPEGSAAEGARQRAAGRVTAPNRPGLGTEPRFDALDEPVLASGGRGDSRCAAAR